MEYWNKDQIKIPKLGFGTSMLKGPQAVSAVQSALSAGLRHIDTAQIYNNEEEVGTAIKASSVRREDIFLTTKIWRSCFAPSEVKSSFEKSRHKLKTDYVDLLLLHWPPDSSVPLEETLKAFEDLKKEGQIRHIGVSNFTCDLLKKVKALCPDLLTNQVEYHPLLSQKKLLDLADKLNVLVTAYSPLMRGKIFQIQQILKIAEKYNKSPSQIALKWLVNQKNVVVIFKASSQKHIEENMNIFDFEMEESDREKIFRLNNNKQKIIDPPFSPKWDH